MYTYYIFDLTELINKYSYKFRTKNISIRGISFDAAPLTANVAGRKVQWQLLIEVGRTMNVCLCSIAGCTYNL